MKKNQKAKPEKPKTLAYEDFPGLAEAERLLAAMESREQELTARVRDLEAAVTDEKAGAENIDALARQLLDGAPVQFDDVDRAQVELRQARRELLVASRARELQAEDVRKERRHAQSRIQASYVPRYSVAAESLRDSYVGLVAAIRGLNRVRYAMEASLGEDARCASPELHDGPIHIAFNAWQDHAISAGWLEPVATEAEGDVVRVKMLTSIAFVPDAVKRPEFTSALNENTIHRLPREDAQRLIGAGQAERVADDRPASWVLDEIKASETVAA